MSALKRTKTTIALAACLALAAISPTAASAALGDNYGVTDALGAAWQGPKAWWAGTCDLESPSTANGGVGTPPASFGSCIDAGTAYTPRQEPGAPPADTVWEPGSEPSWRLDPVVQAGAHPDGSASFWLNRTTELVKGFPAQSDGDTKQVIVRLPPGFAGDPQATPQCPSGALETTPPLCHPSTQIGYIIISLGMPAAEESVATTVYPLWNVEPREGKTAEFIVSPGGTPVERTNVVIDAKVRSDGDYGVDSFVMNIPSGLPLLGQTVTLWSIPWAKAHDVYRPRAGYIGHSRQTPSGSRSFAGLPLSGLSGLDAQGNPDPEQDPQSYDPSWGPIKPFFANPSRCGDPGATTLELTSWHRVNEPKTYEAQAEPITGCDALDSHFKPDISLKPTAHAADTPTGLEVELSVPQNPGPPLDPPAPGASEAEVDQYVADATAYWKSAEGLATPHLKDTVVTLPEGVSVNPAAANGQQACTTEQIGLLTTSGAMPAPIRFDESDPDDGVGRECPDASKVGTVSIETPLLKEADWPAGEVYLAAQRDNPFDSMLAIYAVLRSPKRGFIAKLAGEVTADPVTGRLTTRFLNNPQLPFSRFSLRFKGGPGAPLATPTTCGNHVNRTALTPWSANEASDTVVVTRGEFDVSSGAGGSACPASPAARPFSLGLQAGTANPLAGAHAPFELQLTRPDGAQEIDRLELTTPRGFTASLRGIPYCAEGQIAAAAARRGRAEQASPSCPAASRIGSVLSGAGAGPNPLYVPGELYLAGPYKGAPLSMAAVIPAVAGPFDLGVVVVRTALRIDPATAQITSVTDPLPKILEGIPLRVRDIRVRIDRPSFALNPTSCEEQQITARVFGSHGAVADLGNRFQVGGCERLGFKPKLSFRLKGGTKRGDFPALSATLNARPGDANIGRVSVALPRSAFLEQGHIRTVCTRVQFAANSCPPGSVYGYARAWSPLLDAPLQGPVYLRSSNNKLPDMVADLEGQIGVEVSGRIDSVRGQIRNTFDVVPDAAVSKFTLTLKGGKKGLLVNSRNLCAKPSRAIVRMRAHNGKKHDFRPLVKPQCRKQKKAARKGRNR